MFKRAAVFTDLHLGLKNNSQTHNQDCEDFVDWFIDQAKQNNCETGIFCGDWNHNRSSLNLTTMDTGIRLLEKLGAAFDNFYMFAGNHDLYYKDRRDVKSTEFARHIPGITVIDEISTIDDVTLVPWLIGNEWRGMSRLKSKYVFGHFELPSFYMNAMVQMPDHGELKSEHFENQKYVFSGHFHKRQRQGKIHYIGNAFPHNFADAWDDARGLMVLDRENDAEPVYIDWPDCPKYRTAKLSDIIDPNKKIIEPKMYVKAIMDIECSYEEANYVKELFVKQYNCRDFTLVQNKDVSDFDSDLDIGEFESVDSIVTRELTAIDSESFDNKTLLDIYKNLN